MAGTVNIRYIPVNITTAAGTAIAAPVVTPVDLGDVVLIEARLRIPTGHAGFTGWRLDYSGETIVPWSHPSQYIVGDGDDLVFQIEHEVGRTLQVVTYNRDVYAHTHYCTMKITDLAAPALAPVQFVDVAPAGS